MKSALRYYCISLYHLHCRKDSVANRDYGHGDSLAWLDGRKRLAASAEPARSGKRRITMLNEKSSNGNDGRERKIHKGIEAESETTDGKKGEVGLGNGSC
ncbi:hypothetical protein Tcan_04681 [Toxocara canis]|uniref:Uncharacterized protein n=1 Tax=Toxocara canis TaxID=6265 RepID=A0A0B2VT92_TOXCA|nr:hypothetical protein Tcan_04681 [Toxocara canis]